MHACCRLGNTSHAGREQLHPGTANLMAGFQCSGQDARGWGVRLARGERKQGNATGVRTCFLAGRKLVLLPCLQLAAIFRKLDQLQKNKSFSLFNYSCGSPCAEGPSVPRLLWERMRTKTTARQWGITPSYSFNISHKDMTPARTDLSSMRHARPGRLWSQFPVQPPHWLLKFLLFMLLSSTFYPV